MCGLGGWLGVVVVWGCVWAVCSLFFFFLEFFFF